MSGRAWRWLTVAVFYGVFWFWYTPLGGPLTAAEIERFSTALERRDSDPGRVAALRRFMAEDTGGQFFMVNLLDLADPAPPLPATGPDAPAQSLLDHYMAHMYPELARRASHPVFVGRAVAGPLDLAGIDDAAPWSRAALMRYRSRRDMLEIATHPAFAERHEYKVAALARTVAFPVEADLYLSDPRLLLAVVVLLLSMLVELLVSRRPSPAA